MIIVEITEFGLTILPDYLNSHRNKTYSTFELKWFVLMMLKIKSISRKICNKNVNLLDLEKKLSE